MKPNKQFIKLILLGLLAMMMLNFPLLSLSSKTTLVGGIPSLYVYVFVVWMLILVLLFLILNKSSSKKKGEEHD